MKSDDQKTLARRLHDAIVHGDVASVRQLLENGAFVDGWWDAEEAVAQHEQLERYLSKHREKYRKEILAESDLDPEIAELTEELDLEYESTPPDGPDPHEIPIHLAVMENQLDCLEVLISAGADVHKRDNFGQTALFHVRSPKAVELLVHAGSDLNAADRRGDDALGELLSEASEDDERRKQELETAEALLHAGVPLLRVHPNWKNSRLFRAAFAENLAAVQFLLREGHPVDSDDEQTALHAICWHWDYDEEAANENTRAIVRTLLDAGIPPDAKDANGNTPLHEALSGDGSNLVAAEILLAAGADINAVNSDGQTPLLYHYETLFDYERVVPFMLERGANPLLRDRHNQNVLDAARRMIEGGEPAWRTEEFGEQPPCGWKHEATPGDNEYRILRLLEDAAARFQ